MARLIPAMGSYVEKHLLDQTHLTSLHCGQKTGHLGMFSMTFPIFFGLIAETHKSFCCNPPPPPYFVAKATLLCTYLTDKSRKKLS
jgi:hypothetical protein